MDARAVLLRAARSGFASYSAEAASAALRLDAAACATAVATLIAEGLIHDPVRLAPGALHCHWRLELTPSGRAAARTLTGD